MSFMEVAPSKHPLAPLEVGMPWWSAHDQTPSFAETNPSQEQAREALACFPGDDVASATPTLDALGSTIGSTDATGGERFEDFDPVRTLLFDAPQWGMDAFVAPTRLPQVVTPDDVSVRSGLFTPKGPQGFPEVIGPYFQWLNGLLQGLSGAVRLSDGDRSGAYDLGQGASDVGGATVAMVNPSSKAIPGFQVASGAFDIAGGADKVWSAEDGDTGAWASGLTDVAKGTAAATAGMAPFMGPMVAPAAVPLAALAGGMEIGQCVAESGRRSAVEGNYFGDNRTPGEWAGDGWRDASDTVNDTFGTEYLGEIVTFLPALGAGMGATFYSWGRGVLGI